MTITDDSLNQTVYLLSHSQGDPTNQAYGMELVQQLTPELRWKVAWRLTAAPLTRWRLAARCVLPEPLIEHRLRRFTARCVLRMLLQERAAGREPSEGAWRALELCEQLGTVRGLRGRREVCEVENIRADLRAVVGDWGMYWESERPLGDAEIDLTAIDEARGQWDSLSRLQFEDLLRESEEARWSVTLRTLERIEDAHNAALYALIEPEEELWEVEDYLPRPRTLQEWRWQRRAWRKIVIEGQDGLELVLAPSPAQ